MNVSANHTVRIEYELRIKGGDLLESSEKSGPLEYVHGEHKLLAALEKRIEGMAIGEEKKGVIPAVEAFGDESALPLKELAKKEFPADEKLTPGRVFEAKAPGQDTVRFKVVTVDGEKVSVRFLHPLFDKDIEFRVKVLAVDPPGARRSVLRPPPPPAQAFGLDADIVVAEDDK